MYYHRNSALRFDNMNRIGLIFVPFILSLVAIFQTSFAEKVKTNVTPIEHVIVLMLENRSFDHMLGFLKKSNSNVEGCLPNAIGCSNSADPQIVGSPSYTVDDSAIYVQTSPSHSISGTTYQLYGSSVADTANPAPMSGFVKSYTDVTGTPEGGATVMKCFSPENVPILANLSMEFALFDGWHAAIPGPTMPNRAYAASASSHGMGTNDEKTIAKGMPQKSVFRQIEEMGLDYRVYFELVPAVMMLKDVRHRDARPRFHAMKQFYADVQAGDMPEFAWLEPRYYNTPNFGADDQHPDHDVGLGEQLVKNIYEAVRASPIWDKTALIITYDEHGGFFDHVAPASSVPNPDDINFTDDEGNILFDFSRHGVRIPTVIVSPWVKKGTLVHAAPEGSGQYEHSSIIATVVHKLFRPQLGRPKPSYLNKRDEWAATFESVFTRLAAPRNDCPVSLPKPVFQSELGVKTVHSPDGSSIINDLQLELLYVVAGVSEDISFNSTEAMKWTELTAAQYIQTKMNAYFERKIVEI